MVSRTPWHARLTGSFPQSRVPHIEIAVDNTGPRVGGGTGYQFYETDRTNLALEGGLTYVDTDFIAGVDERYPAVRWALKFDHFLFKSRSQFFHTHEAYAAIDQSDNAFVRSQTGLRFPLVYQVTGTLQYNVDWEKNPTPGRVPTDTTVQFTLGYTW